MKSNLFFILFLISSCSILDQEPRDKIDTDLAFNTEENAIKAVNGLYNELQSIYDWRLQVMGDLPSDIVQSVDTWDAFITIDEYRTTQDNSEIGDLYTVLYRAINLANNIISQVPKLKLTAEKENDIVGQALCIRGLMYFELTRIWGGFPGVYENLGVILRTEPTTETSSDIFGTNSTLTDSYSQVQQDLEKSLDLLPDTRGSNDLDRGRMIKNTSKALLARLHLYMKNYSLAEKYSTEVIVDSRYQLVTPFENIFNTKNSTESILEIQYSLNDISGLRNWYFPPALGGRGGLAFHEDFYNELKENQLDNRAKMVALNPVLNVYYPTKYSLPGNADNTHVIRLAELYLIRAEARAYLDNLLESKNDLNTVRHRANIGDIAAETKEDIISAILNERKIEFFQEGHRWFDLVRTGKALEVLQNLKRSTGSQLVSLTDQDKQVFPYPSAEILVNSNLIQNKAYK